MKKQEDPSEKIIKTPKVETQLGWAVGSYRNNCQVKFTLLKDAHGE